MVPSPRFISRTRPARASASSTFERMRAVEQLLGDEARSPTRLGGGAACSESVWLREHDLGRARGGAAGAAAGAAAARPSARRAKASCHHRRARWPGSRPFSLRLYLTAMAASISCTTATKRLEHALALGGHRGKGLPAPEVQRPGSSSASGLDVRQVLLVVLDDQGHLLGHQPVREQVDLHVLEGRLVLLERRLAGESATNTTASAPARTTRRVALYWTWPGTV